MVVESASVHRATTESPALVADIDGIHSEYTFAGPFGLLSTLYSHPLKSLWMRRYGVIGVAIPPINNRSLAPAFAEEKPYLMSKIT